jgi:hypothetical protein
VNAEFYQQSIPWLARDRGEDLQVGDEIRGKIVESGSADEPVRRRRNHPAETLKAKKRYVRRWVEGNDCAAEFPLD